MSIFIFECYVPADSLVLLKVETYNSIIWSDLIDTYGYKEDFHFRLTINNEHADEINRITYNFLSHPMLP
ncbi:hypothetical protein COL26_29035 [Bacillus thuringiensis]|uniref:Uncharacterized protein n=1 Tax=Bacillus thuringiensis TaxID=1428 RepID=A0ABD6S518_BACTU|nr:hypothetical protein [Bacillus thuringiensis]PER53807.1 hypothetical protein CN495_12305 [Bacillus thuringiensis]PEU98566.1 hypothetical protein CN411_00345 [Bacillus thuringiensis]PFI08308.1 hypothetical protein COI79_15175 [Bacillus thuringiensis]PFW29107.1 hypothetical protein COL26_29035 [Bacillus thuringiensis]PGY78550.1 hypothetical protein COE44_14030 [Bacillus thuringiensis]